MMHFSRLQVAAIYSKKHKKENLESKLDNDLESFCLPFDVKMCLDIFKCQLLNIKGNFVVCVRY